MATTATKPAKSKRDQNLFSTAFDAAGRQRIKLAKPVAQTLWKACGYVTLLAKGCPALNKTAGEAEIAMNALLKALSVLGGLDALDIANDAVAEVAGEKGVA